MYDDACGRGDGALNAQDDERGSRGVRAKESKDESDKIRINGRNPGSRAGVDVERRAEALAANDVRGNAADFHAERIVGVLITHIGFRPKDKCKSQQETNDEQQNVKAAIAVPSRTRVGWSG